MSHGPKHETVLRQYPALRGGFCEMSLFQGASSTTKNGLKTPVPSEDRDLSSETACQLHLRGDSKPRGIRETIQL
jgi:hypothetical protein